MNENIENKNEMQSSDKLNEVIEISNNTKGIVLNRTKVLKGMLSTIQNEESNEIFNQIKSIVNNIPQKRLFDKENIEPYTPERAELRKKIYDEYIQKHDVKDFLTPTYYNNINELVNAVSLFEDGNDPFPYLKIIENIDISLIEDKFILDKINKLNNDIIIITKKQIFEKWNDNILKNGGNEIFKDEENGLKEMWTEVENLNKYRYANYLESINLLIKAFDCAKNTKINPKMCYIAANLIIVELLDDFDVTDFFERYYYYLLNKFKKFSQKFNKKNSKKNNKWTKTIKKDVNLCFINKFYKEYMKSLNHKASKLELNK